VRKTHIPLLLILFSLASQVSAQQLPVSDKYSQYDADRLSPAFHKSRRDSVLKYMGERTIALFPAALPKRRANDVMYEYHQDPNFYYLSGHIQPHAVLLLTKIGTPRQILFVDKKDPASETWTGARLGSEGAKEILGFTESYPIEAFPHILDSLLLLTDTVYYRPNYEAVQDLLLDSTFDIYQDVKQVFSGRHKNITVASLQNLLAKLRMIKTPEELAIMKKVISISNMGHNEIIKTAKPGWYEYQIQALGEFVFKNNGAEYTGYPCIVGSGNNSTILHYETNRRQTQNGDFIEMDIGAEYHGYSADITRSFPINGHFTAEQRAIYDIVLEAQDSGIAAARIGNGFKAPHNAAVSVVQKGLLKLGIIKSADEYRKYFMHGTSHFLGLDVHDAGVYGPLEENSIITVEPGIYIAEGSPCDPKWWRIGCRIEDDILITKNGPVNLSSASPRTALEIEQLMQKGK
jgi:Xaa-Pro aminopeptidase